MSPAPAAPVRIGAVDLGSNSFHLLVVEAHPDGTFETLVREKEMLRLGDQVSRTGRIGDAATEKVLATLGRFRDLAESLEADEVVACATSAFREAEDSTEVVDRIETETGLRVEVISGHREAELIFGAVRASVAFDRPPALCFDLGGGSLEVMVGDQSGLHWATSVKLGVARLSAELVSSDPPSADDERRLRSRLTSILAPVADEVAPFAPHMAVGTSGTLCDLARMAEAHRSGNVPTSVNQLTVGRDDLLAVHEEILRLKASERKRLSGLDSRRVDLIPAGSMLLVTAMELFGFETLTVGEWALREGIVLDAIGHHEAADWSGDPRAIRRSSVLGLARRCNWDEAHGTQVARLATDLFDQTTSLHGLGPDDRDLLENGALLHDIGEHVSTEGHHKHTAYLIEYGRLRGFSPEEVGVLATLGRFHRRSDPKGSFEHYGRLDGERRAEVLKLLALLRVADGLDRGHDCAVQRIETTVGDEVVRIRVVGPDDGDVDVELWGLRRKRDLFERVFEVRLEAVAAGQETALSA